MIRSIKEIIKGKPVLEGAGVHLKRVFGFSEVPNFDPFLLLDDFRSDVKEHYIKGFPWHPHRGIETITYVLAGEVDHSDSLGNEGTIGPGDTQWMTAGSGIIHQEMPRGDKQGRMYGFQLWLNLPASDKMISPCYRDIKSKDIPVLNFQEGVEIRIICGRIQGTEGPAKNINSDPQYLDISIKPNSIFEFPTNPSYTVFAYIIEGNGVFGSDQKTESNYKSAKDSTEINQSELIENQTLVLYEKGDSIKVQSYDETLRFLLISGKPINEPVAWYGPIVMNTQEELQKAFEEFRNGTFLKK